MTLISLLKYLKLIGIKYNISSKSFELHFSCFDPSPHGNFGDLKIFSRFLKSKWRLPNLVKYFIIKYLPVPFSFNNSMLRTKFLSAGYTLEGSKKVFLSSFLKHCVWTATGSGKWKDQTLNIN